MVDLAAVEVSVFSLGKEEVAFEEEEFESPRFGSSQSSVIFSVGIMGFFRAAFPLAAIVDNLVFLSRHDGVLVGKVEEIPRDLDSDELITIE